MRFYLPAYMVWYLQNWGTEEIWTDHTLYSLDDHAKDAKLAEYHKERFSLFTQEQLRACALFVKFCAWDIDTLEYAGDESVAVTNLYVEFTSVPSSIDTQMRDIVRYRAGFGFSGEVTENLNYEFNTINDLESALDSALL